MDLVEKKSLKQKHGLVWSRKGLGLGRNLLLVSHQNDRVFFLFLTLSPHHFFNFSAQFNSLSFRFSLQNEYIALLFFSFYYPKRVF